MSGRNSPRIGWIWWLLAIALLLAWQYGSHDDSQGVAPPVVNSPASGSKSDHAPARPAANAPSVSQPVANARLPAFLPAEARTTIGLIQRGGPFPHRQDGSVFGNREGHLPRKPRGWYREYTVETLALSHRGARRIVTGGNPPKTWHYTSDHYESFRAFDPDPSTGAMQ